MNAVALVSLPFSQPPAHTVARILTQIPLHRIIPGVNQRSGRTPESLALLTESVRQVGVLQSVMVTQVPDSHTYTLVAGHGRYQAAMTARGKNYEIPAIILDPSDACTQLATFENIHREPLCAIDEAEAASKMLGLCVGNRDETAKMLGWSSSKLTKRLALMNCSRAVQTALATGQILLGHAELLCSLDKPVQDKLLDPIITEKKPVRELLDTIQRAAAKLDQAIFDKTACNGCCHNSSFQAEMFENAITEGSCTNRACFKQKTDARLEDIAQSLKDDYPIIRIVRPGDNATVISLKADGPQGVGEEQAKACRSCQHFGAAVSGLPTDTGKIFPNQCFNPTCHADKVAEHAADHAIANAKAPGSGTVPVSLPAPANTPSKTPASPPSSPAKTTAKTTASTLSAPPSPPAVAKISEAVQKYRLQTWKRVLQAHLANDPELTQRCLLALSLMGLANKIDSTALGKAFSQIAERRNSVTDLGACLTQVSELPTGDFTRLSRLQAVSAIANLEEHHVAQLVRQLNPSLSSHWKLDQALLQLITKTEIMAIAVEVGLNRQFSSEHAFKSLAGEKKDVLITKLLSWKNVDYSQAIPAIMRF